MVKVPQ